jgi:hypothetical protein
MGEAVGEGGSDEGRWPRTTGLLLGVQLSRWQQRVPVSPGGWWGCSDACCRASQSWHCSFAFRRCRLVPRRGRPSPVGLAWHLQQTGSEQSLRAPARPPEVAACCRFTRPSTVGPTGHYGSSSTAMRAVLNRISPVIPWSRHRRARGGWRRHRVFTEGHFAVPALSCCVPHGS